MKPYYWILPALLLICFSCVQEDPGPRQQDTRDFALLDFDRIDAGAALVLKVEQGAAFSIHAEGDRRNLDDLSVKKAGTTLELGFINSRDRQYATYITITMPHLRGVMCSGAVNATVSNFTETPRMDLVLTGASTLQAVVSVPELVFNASGASQLRLQGSGDKLDGTVTGSSVLSAFDYSVSDCKLVVSGASVCKVSAASTLTVNASGASEVVYHGNPQLTAATSGASAVRQE